jgi:DNA-binding NarL/FixJ family response regulator
MASTQLTREEMWSRQQISRLDVDYDFWNRKRELIRQMSQISQSCLFTVDVFKGRYDFVSSGFSDLFGYKPERISSIEENGNFLEDMVHPDDLETLIKMQIDHSHFIYSLEPQCRNYYSNTYKFRMQNAQKKHLNVISRQRVIEQDVNGKAWIILGEVNILPDQRSPGNVQKITVNLKTGKIIHSQDKFDYDTSLSKREIEILKLVRMGYLSKEIADKLCISLNTVNNHRKNILRRLQVSNSMEAVNAAFKNVHL